MSPAAKRVGIWLTAAGIVLAAFALALSTAWKASEKQTRRMPDGSTLRLKTVTYQKKHTERVGNRFQDYLVPFIPEGLALKLGCKAVAAGGSNMLCFWFLYDGVASGNAPRLRVATFDEHGCEFGLTEASDKWYRTTQQALFLAQFSEFPRRGKTIGLRLYAPGTNGTCTRLAEFTVPNPDQRAFPVWQAEPLPITKTVSNVDFALVAAKTGVHGQLCPPQLPAPGEPSGVYLRFRLAEKGRPTSAWGLAAINGLADACGHNLGSRGWSRSSGGNLGEGGAAVVFAAGLCREESAWRLNVEFARETDFPSDETWTVRGVPVPDEKSASVVGAETNLRGVGLQLCGLVGKECPMPIARRSRPNSPLVHVICTNLGAELELKLASVVDDQGRPVNRSGFCGDLTNRLFGVSLPPQARSVDVTFAVTRRVPVEYLFKPSKLTAADIKELRQELGYR